MCHVYSAMRDDLTTEAQGVFGDNSIFGPIHGAKITLHCGLHGIEVEHCHKYMFSGHVYCNC